jgi:hypothetical protein
VYLVEGQARRLGYTNLRGSGTDLRTREVALPLLRPLRVLRLVTLLNVLNRRVASSLRGRSGFGHTFAQAARRLRAVLGVFDHPILARCQLQSFATYGTAARAAPRPGRATTLSRHRMR